MRYDFVVGYAFSENLEQVVLIRKTHPFRLAGKLNGVGGGVRKKDKDEPATMLHEFSDEAAGPTQRKDWIEVTSFENINGKKIIVYAAADNKFLGAETVPHKKHPAKTEEIFILFTEQALQRQDLLPEVPEQILQSMQAIRAARTKKMAP